MLADSYAVDIYITTNLGTKSVTLNLAQSTYKLEQGSDRWEQAFTNMVARKLGGFKEDYINPLIGKSRSGVASSGATTDDKYLAFGWLSMER